MKGYCFTENMGKTNCDNNLSMVVFLQLWIQHIELMIDTPCYDFEILGKCIGDQHSVFKKKKGSRLTWTNGAVKNLPNRCWIDSDLEPDVNIVPYDCRFSSFLAKCLNDEIDFDSSFQHLATFVVGNGLTKKKMDILKRLREERTPRQRNQGNDESKEDDEVIDEDEGADSDESDEDEEGEPSRKRSRDAADDPQLVNYTEVKLPNVAAFKLDVKEIMLGDDDDKAMKAFMECRKRKLMTGFKWSSGSVNSSYNKLNFDIDGVLDHAAKKAITSKDTDIFLTESSAITQPPVPDGTRVCGRRGR